jgi:hypothetical protein
MMKVIPSLVLHCFWIMEEREQKKGFSRYAFDTVENVSRPYIARLHTTPRRVQFALVTCEGDDSDILAALKDPQNHLRDAVQDLFSFAIAMFFPTIRQ